MQKDNSSASLSLVEKLDSTLREQLHSEGFELTHLISVPSRGDRNVRARTIAELLQSLSDIPQDAQDGETRTYLIEVRSSPSKKTPAAHAANRDTSATPKEQAPTEPIRHSDGSWNYPFLVKNAEILSRHGEHKDARPLWHILSKNHDTSSHAHYQLGAGYEQDAALEKARTHYQESLAFEPQLATVQALARVYLKLKKDADAARVLERGTSLTALSPDIRSSLQGAASNAWYRAGKLELAEAAAVGALEGLPDNVNLLTNLGTLRLKGGRIAEARGLFQKAVQKKPNLAAAHEGLALCYLEEGQRRAAHDQLVRALASQIANPRALQLLVRLAFELRIYSVAARILEEYISAQPVTSGLIYSLAGLQFLLGRYTDALGSASRVLGLQPAHPGATDLIRRIDRIRMDASSIENSSPRVMEDAQNGHGRQLTPR
jgi:tetratricopeptide (TPR) repeat protein